MTIYQAVKIYCSTECCDSIREATGCQNMNCPLWIYRQGHDPARRRKIPPLQPRDAKSGRYNPLYNGSRKIIRAVSDGQTVSLGLADGRTVEVTVKEPKGDAND